MCENNCTTRCLPKVQHLGRADLDKKSAQMWCDLHPTGHISEREEADRNYNRSCTPNHWPLQPMENLELYSTVILVATNGHRHRSLLQIVWKVLDQQNQHTETTRVLSWLIHFLANNHLASPSPYSPLLGGASLFGPIRWSNFYQSQSLIPLTASPPKVPLSPPNTPATSKAYS